MTLSVIDAAREVPSRPALIIDGVAIDYATLALGARRAARRLLDNGATPERPVAFVAHSDRAHLELLYALIALGIPALPVHPRWTEAERARVQHIVEPAHDEVPPLPESAFSTSIDDARPLAILHTSGTSGAPKRVVLSRRAFSAAAAASADNLGWQDGDRWLLCLPFAHVGGLSIVTRCLLARRTVVVRRRRRSRRRASATASRCCRSFPRCSSGCWTAGGTHPVTSARSCWAARRRRRRCSAAPRIAAGRC